MQASQRRFDKFRIPLAIQMVRNIACNQNASKINRKPRQLLLGFAVTHSQSRERPLSGKAVTRGPDLGGLRLNVCFSRKRTFNPPKILDSDRQLTARSGRSEININGLGFQLRTTGCVTRDSLLHMTFKLGQCAEQNWRKLRGFAYYLAKVFEGVKFVNGEEIEQPSQLAA